MMKSIEKRSKFDRDSNEASGNLNDKLDRVLANQLVIKNHLFQQSVSENKSLNIKTHYYGQDFNHIYWPVNQDLQSPINPPKTIKKLKQSSEEVIDELMAFYRQIFIGNLIDKVKFLLTFTEAKFYEKPFKFAGYEPPKDYVELFDDDYEDEDEEEEIDESMAN